MGSRQRRTRREAQQVIALLDNGQDLDACSEEIGADVGQLLTPLTRYRLRDPSKPWAIDNGAFSSFDQASFLSLLERESSRKADCLFVTAPDVVSSARRTLEVFEHWKSRLAGWNIALVCQDGQESLPIPWSELGAIFIGGSTAWKISDNATHCIKAAQLLGKWVHVGRVNDPQRFEHFLKLGVDSIDGTGIARYSHMREAIAKRNNQGSLLQC
jgi:hypothetical protein